MLVVPRYEAGTPSYMCENRSVTPLPDTQIAPVHQEPSTSSSPNNNKNNSSSSSSSTIIRSMIGSARSKVGPLNELEQTSMEETVDSDLDPEPDQMHDPLCLCEAHQIQPHQGNQIRRTSDYSGKFYVL